MRRVREELEDRIGAKTPVLLAVVAWVSVGVFGTAPEQFAATLIGGAITGVAGLVADAYDLRSGVRQAGLGLTALFGATALFVAKGSILLPAALGLIGAWLALDGAQSLRHGGIGERNDPQPDGETVYRVYLRRQVRERLGDRPRSGTELREAMDADAGDVDAALAELRERDLVSLRGGVYHHDTPDSPGRLARARNRVVGGLRRLGRPVAVEFRDDDPYTKESGPASDRDTSPAERTDRPPGALSEGGRGSSSHAGARERGEPERADR